MWISFLWTLSPHSVIPCESSTPATKAVCGYLRTACFYPSLCYMMLFPPPPLFPHRLPDNISVPASIIPFALYVKGSAAPCTTSSALFPKSSILPDGLIFFLVRVSSNKQQATRGIHTEDQGHIFQAASKWLAWHKITYFSCFLIHRWETLASGFSELL